MNKELLLLLLSACLLSAATLARPIRGASAASSEEFPASDPLPYDSEVEYLMSTGTQYINTYLYPKVGYEYRFEITPNTSRFGYIFGSMYNNLYTGIAQASDKWVLYNTTGSRKIDLGLSVGTRYSFVFNQSSLFINGIPCDGVFGTSNVKAPMGVFARLSKTSSPDMFASNVAIHNFQVFDGDTPVLDFLPVRFTNEFGETEGAMYDRVSKTLFRNSGTGSFVIGPDL